MKPNWNRVYVLAIILVVLTGGLGYGFTLVFNAHSTLALIGIAGVVLAYVPTVVKLAGLIGREFEQKEKQ